MQIKKLNIIKIGGNIIDDNDALIPFIEKLSQLTETCLLVHGGGKQASALSNKLGIETKLINGRRITDTNTLELVTMVFAGLINKKIVALLQAKQCNAIGLSGVDANLIRATKRIKTNIDYGFAGDVDPSNVNIELLNNLIKSGMIPVIAPITHDGKGQLLNTNADCIASVLAIALSSLYKVNLIYCFEHNGVLKHTDDINSVFPYINKQSYLQLKKDSVIAGGMIPKLDHAFDAIENGVDSVVIGDALQLINLVNEQKNEGTHIIA